MSETNPYLADLSIISTNPEVAQAIAECALQGDKNAQYALGVLYAEGRGVVQNTVEAYAWLTAATMQGDDDALQLRSMIESIMTPHSIELAEERAGIMLMHDEQFENQH